MTQPQWPVRGLMLDPARLTERHAFYFDLLPHLARWGINTLWWHFVDDQGFVLRLDSHPELASPHAFTKPELRRFIAAAQKLGIDVVPEVEALGHAGYITHLRRYAGLADGDRLGFNAVCPSRPETLALLGEIIREVAEAFPSPYFHAGLDEVNFADCPRCARRARGKPAWWIYAEHTRAIHAILRGCGKRMIMWADHVERDPAMLRVLPKDIVMAHWHYTDVPIEPLRRSLRAGFDAICAPALCHWGDVIQPNAANFANMDETLRVMARVRGPRLLGLANTWWVGWRGLRDAYLPAIAYTGQMVRTGRPADKRRFARAFVADHYGIKASAVGDALWEAHELAPNFTELNALLPDSAADVFNGIALAKAPDFEARAAAAARCHAALSQGVGRVRRNRPAFAASVLAAQLTAEFLGQGRAWLEVHKALRDAEWLRDSRGAAAARTALRKALARLRATRRGLERLCRAVDREWDRTRYPDDPIKSVTGRADTPCGIDVLLGRMVRSVDYLKRAEAHFARAMRARRLDQMLPGWP